MENYFFNDLVNILDCTLEAETEKKRLAEVKKQYKILTRAAAVKQGCDPSFDKNWSNDGKTSIYAQYMN